MSREETYDLIDKYLNGQLQGEELDIFRIRLKEDSNLSYDLAVQKLIRTELEKKRKAELKALIADSGKIAYMQNIWGKRWMYASAAIVLFFVVSYFVVEYVLKPGLPLASEEIAKEEVPKYLPSDNKTNIKRGRNSKTTQKSEEEVASDLAVVNPETQVEEDESTELDEIFSGGFTDSDTSNLFDEEKDVVLKDEMIARRTVNAVVVVASEIAKAAPKEAMQQKKVKSENMSEDEPSVPSEINAGTDKAALNTRVIVVEYWKSPVLFTGYSFTGSVLKLYSIDTESELLLQEYEHQLYMRYKGTWYLLSTTNEPVHLKKLSERSILPWLEP